jgi:hypothetical protein
MTTRISACALAR